jgi:BirA family biotin operon repressor/biotin-[acetyl-CoA-carboxylase] ligase
MERTATRWEGCDAAELEREWGVPRVRLYESIGSTNDAARALAAAGAPGGTVVLAERQTAGRGRSGKPWSSPAGLGLWMSMVLRPPAETRPELIPLLVGIGVARALEPFSAIEPKLKWPNDVQLAGRKVAGILCESVWDAGAPGFVIAGVGVNVLHAPADFPAELQGIATSLAAEGGMRPRRVEVAGAIVRAVLALTRAPTPLLDGPIAMEMEKRDALRGHRVAVYAGTADAEPLAGTALGISPDGALMLRTEQGALRAVRSGTVRKM